MRIELSIHSLPKILLRGRIDAPPREGPDATVMKPMSHPTVPREYAGKWIAWDHAMTRIVASGNSLAEVLELAKQAGECDPVLDKVPRGILLPIDVRLRRS